VRLKARLTGLNDIVRALDDIEKKAARKGIRKGINDGTKLLVQSARAYVPVDTKALKKAIGRRVKGYRSGKFVIGVVGARMDSPRKPKKFAKEVVRRGERKTQYVVPAYYAHLVEFGTQPHHIGKGSSIRQSRRSGRMHPGARPKPFLRPAWDEQGAAAQALIRQRVKEAIRELANKARGR
jgi:HK97 gp10 family phage protein